MTPQEQAAFDAMREALESVAKAIPLSRSTVKTCYAINNTHRDIVHEAITAAKAVSEQPATVPNNSQDWKGMDGAIAYHLIDRHADGWADVGKMMGEWLAANQSVQPQAQEPLTKEEVDRLSVGMLNAIGGIYATSTMDFVRAIEAAHGIKE